MSHATYRALMTAAHAARKYHRHEVEGLKSVPRRGRCLLVVSRSLASYDIFMLWSAIYDATGRTTRGLIDRFFARIPGVKLLAQEIGSMEGDPNAARTLLEKDELVCVAPGGMRDLLRPNSKRYSFNWEGRLGFVKLAMETQTPIVLAGCPSADELYDVYANPLTKSIYDRFKAPFVLARGLGLSLIPRPVQLTHFLSEPILPPKLTGGEFDAKQLESFQEFLIEKMCELMHDRIQPDAFGDDVDTAV